MQYYGDFTEDAMVYIPFNTFSSNDPQASVTITNLVDADIKVHKDGSATQIVTDGATVAIDFDTVTGNHLITIDTSAHADYSVGSDYFVRIEGTTVDAGTINAWVGSFSIENRWNEANVTHVAGTAQTANDNGADINAILVDTNALNDTKIPDTISLAAINAEADTALSDFFTSAANLVDLMWDEVLTGATHNVANSAGRRLRQLQESGAAYGGHIWIDTVNGTAGTTNYENGTSDNPVDTIADANTLAAALGISRFQVAPGSTITFAASQQNQAFYGTEWTLALGGQNIAGTYIEGASVTGVCTGANHHFVRCAIGNMSSADGKYGWCGLSGTFTMTAAAEYNFHHCFSTVAGGGSPVWDFGAAVGNSNLSLRDHSGGVQIDNKDATGTDSMSLEGNGQLIVSASSGGAISLRGDFKVTNTGGATITYDDNAQNGQDILAMLDDPRAEPGQGAPAVNADLATKIDYLYKAWRNKSTQTATTYSLFDDAGTTVDQKSTVSDDATTATRGEIATGP